MQTRRRATPPGLTSTKIGCMARRRANGLDILAALPWPVGIGAGLLGYWAVRHGAAWYFDSRNGELAGAFS